MKKFLVRILIFAALTVVIDFACGALFPFLRENAKGGRTREEYFIAEKCEAEVLVFGSSRALHHYVPSVIQDSMGLSCFNCGKDGMGSVLAYARYMMLTDRYTPKLVIYDVAPSFDYAADEDNTKYLGFLNPYSYKNGVYKAIVPYADLDAYLLMNSQMYRNNSHILSYMIDCLTNRHFSDSGYQAIHGRLRTNEPYDEIPVQDMTLEIDYGKINLIEEMIQDCQAKGTAFIFVMSPVYGGQYPRQQLQPAMDLAATYGVPFFDYSDVDEIVYNEAYFQDRTHMNDDGARVFSKIVADAVVENSVVPGRTQEE